MSDKPKIKASRVYEMIEAINRLDHKTRDGASLHPLPIRFTYAAARTLQRAKEAVAPLQEELERIQLRLKEQVDEYRRNPGEEPVNDYNKRLTDAANDQWKEFQGTEIEFEPYRFPRDWTDQERDQIDKAHLPATILSVLLSMGFEI